MLSALDKKVRFSLYLFNGNVCSDADGVDLKLRRSYGSAQACVVHASSSAHCLQNKKGTGEIRVNIIYRFSWTFHFGCCQYWNLYKKIAVFNRNNTQSFSLCDRRIPNSKGTDGNNFKHLAFCCDPFILPMQNYKIWFIPFLQMSRHSKNT